MILPTPGAKRRNERQAAPTSKRRPGPFTKPGEEVFAGERRWLSPAKTSSPGERPTALGKQARAKRRRGGTPQHRGLGRLPAPRSSFRLPPRSHAPAWERAASATRERRD